MRVLVCGGRDYSDVDAFKEAMYRLFRESRITAVIHGCATGADRLAQRWAGNEGVMDLGFPADWRKYGKAAGPIRNQQMLDAKPDVVVAFPGGRGTADMVARAKAAGVRVIEPIPPTPGDESCL